MVRRMSADPSNDVVSALVEAGVRAWPAIPLSRDKFEEAVRRKIAAGTAPGDLRAAELFLATACAEGIPQAVAQIEAEHLGKIERAVRRVLVSDALTSDALQTLRYRLFVADGDAPKIASYAGRGSLEGWLRASALRVAIDLQRAEGAAPTQANDEPASDALVTHNPELALIREHHRGDFEGALRDALAALSSRERNVLRLYTADGLTFEQIGQMYGVTRSTISRWMAAIRAQVLVRVRERFAAGEGGPPPELQSFFDLFHSGLDTSIGALLKRSTDA